MARNRKSQSAAIRFGPAVKAVLLCLLIGGSGVGYVWQKNQNEKMRRQLATLRSPGVVEQRIKELNLGLVLPRESQILRLPEPTTFAPPSPQSAQRQAGTSATLAVMQ